MKNMATESKERLEFAAFVDAGPTAPHPSTDAAVMGRVRKALRPPLWRVFGKLALVEAAAGLITLTICPQFGVGFGSHATLLHALHEGLPPAMFYLTCGLLFVLFGAALAGAVLTREEITALGRRKYIYFVAYGMSALTIFLALGAEVFLLAALCWITGAILGNLLGLALGTRLGTARH
jgi:hypothetical protein